MNKDLKQELIDIAPKLASLPQAETNAPDGYFDSFSSKLMNRIKQENIQADAKVIPINSWKKYLAAAMVIFFMGLSIFIYTFQNNTIDDATVEELYLSELDELTIIEYTNTIKTEEVKNDLEVYQQYLDEQSIIEEL